MKSFRLSGLFAILCMFVLLLGEPVIVHATCDPSQQSCSTNYGVGQAQFGTGGQYCDPNDLAHSAHSANYCAGISVGDLGDGNTTNGLGSGGHQANAGSAGVVDRLPSLQLIVNASSTDVGYLSPSSATTTTGTFSVKSYLASGYIVQIASDPPKSSGLGGHTFSTPGSPTASAPGTEQFGINLAANTIGCGAPANYGADPVQIPDSSFSYGTVTSNYNQCGKYMYNKGDTIASSASSSGETDYTISFLYNISTATQDGIYTYNGVIVATSTF